MRIVAILCGCVLVATGCFSAPSEPSSTSLATGVRSIDTQAGASAAGTTPADFAARGWECRASPVPGRTVCSRPNQSFPVPAFPPNVPPDDRAVTVTLLAWENGTFVGTILLIRPEAYAGQPCSSTGEAYIFRPIIGYYECLNRVGP